MPGLPRPAGFGAEPTGARLARVHRSPNFADGAFRNPVPTRTAEPGVAREMLRRSLRRADRIRRAPARPLPVRPLPAAGLSIPPADGLRLTWFGHSTVLAEIDGARILFDPVWGERCSPVDFVGPKRLHPAPSAAGETGGPVDAVVISHDHYDHLDMPSIRALLPTRALFAVPLGVGAHLERWGVPEARILELDWNESVEVAGVRLTCTPARHFCGRGARNARTVLWASWVAAGPDHRVFHSGDTGYFPGFAEIGAEHGPFDASMIQIGAYSDLWPEIHMTPEEGLRAHTDLRGGTLLPIHWGTFNLAPHPWEEPAERTFELAAAAGVPVATPRPGESFEPAGLPEPEPWWREFAVRPERGAAAAAAAADRKAPDRKTPSRKSPARGAGAKPAHPGGAQL